VPLLGVMAVAMGAIAGCFCSAPLLGGPWPVLAMGRGAMLGVALLGPLLNAMVGCHCDGILE